MIGFRSGTPWKIMLALMYYALSFAGFTGGVFKGVAVLVVAWVLPTFILSVAEAVKGKTEQLYTIPVFIAAIGLSIVFFSADKQSDIKTATADVSAVADMSKLSSPEPAIEPVYSEEEKVFITKSGEKYHSDSCRFVKNKETVPVSVQEAQSSGRTACTVCLE